MKKIQLLIAIALVAFMYACGGGESADSGSAAGSAAPEADAAPAVAEIEIAGGDDMKFDLTEIRVKAGQTVKLTLTHIGKLPKEAMGHNWVLLQQGVDMAAFATAAMAAAESDYIPEGDGDKVIASTTVIGGGESTSVEFEAPAAGTYDFLCSFPGHYVVMQGKFIVE